MATKKALSTKKFKYDNRDKPSLHALYVKFAISGILAIDQAIKRISDEHKTTHCGILHAMYQQRSKLIRENACHAEAEEFMLELVQKKLLSKRGDIFIAYTPNEEE